MCAARDICDILIVSYENNFMSYVYNLLYVRPSAHTWQETSVKHTKPWPEASIKKESIQMALLTANPTSREGLQASMNMETQLWKDFRWQSPTKLPRWALLNHFRLKLYGVFYFQNVRLIWIPSVTYYLKPENKILKFNDPMIRWSAVYIVRALDIKNANF